MLGAATSSSSRPTSKDGNGHGNGNGSGRPNLWSSMLDGAASAKKLPEKNLIVLGGNPDSQREFLETLSPDSADPRAQRKGKAPPFSTQYALGYTYQDVVDADHEGTVVLTFTPPDCLLCFPSPTADSYLHPT
ncbi:hypothetical protein KEM52_004138 [Ascosphaera acerosa]|nr:hypothetical protein KEM52_004138 [Ascosphaera acerosa]